MQYLLSEDEMAEVRREREERQRLPVMVALVNVCQHVATSMVDLNPPNCMKPMERPHGCIHVPDPRGEEWQTRYCDRCSVQGICPQPKEWSK